MKRLTLITAVAAMVAATAIAAAQPPRGPSPDKSYVPSLGGIMAALQLQHFKLWLASKRRNWDLAAYESRQIRGSLQDAVVLYAGIPVPNVALVAAPMAALDNAIAARSSAKFAPAFDALTAACNGCHQAIGRGYIVIQIPAASPFGNQQFEPDGRR